MRWAAVSSSFSVLPTACSGAMEGTALRNRSWTSMSSSPLELAVQAKAGISSP